jgi:hypothetical protein
MRDTLRVISTGMWCPVWPVKSLRNVAASTCQSRRVSRIGKQQASVLYLHSLWSSWRCRFRMRFILLRKLVSSHWHVHVHLQVSVRGFHTTWDSNSEYNSFKSWSETPSSWIWCVSTQIPEYCLQIYRNYVHSSVDAPPSSGQTLHSRHSKPCHKRDDYNM